jgi:hypothetical protein
MLAVSKFLVKKNLNKKEQADLKYNKARNKA